MNLQQSEQGANKLTNWAGEPTVAALKLDLEMAKPYRDKVAGKIEDWNHMLNATGKHAAPKVAGRSQVQPKMVRRQAEWRYAPLSEPFLGTNKMFKVSPATFEDADAAAQNELVLNYQMRTKMNKVKFIDDYVRSVVDDGTTVLRVGWKRQTITINEKVPVYDHLEIQSQEDMDAFQQALELKQSDPRGYDENISPELRAAIDLFEETQQISVAVANGQFENVPTEKVLINQPTVEVLDPRNVFVDPNCDGDIDKALFVIVSFETSQAELKKEPKRYKNLDKVLWSQNTPITETEHTSKSTPDVVGFGDDLRRRVVAYEYWGFYDIRKDGVLRPIVCTWIGATMIRMEENPFPDQKVPFILVPYLPVKRELFGEADASLLGDNQAIAGALTRGMIDTLARSANGQLGFAKGMLDPVNRRRYDKGLDYEFNPQMNPNAGGLIEHTYPELPASGLSLLQLMNQDAEALTGVKSFSGGISGQAYGDVAAGIRGALDAASKREMSILRRLAKGIVDLGNKFISMNGAFLSDKEVIRVTNTKFITVKREDLTGNFDLEVDISTAEVDDQKVKDIGFILQTMGPDTEPEMKYMLIGEIAALKRMPVLANQLKNWKPTPDPVQEELKQLALQKARLENEELQSQIDLNKAKAEEARAKKDQADLDYVEQETGTAHARDMEKGGAQARGNMDLQVTKALTTPHKEGEKAPDVEAAIGFNELSERMQRNGNGLPPKTEASPVDNAAVRDELAQTDPRFSLGSRFYQPELDPARNPNISI